MTPEAREKEMIPKISKNDHIVECDFRRKKI
jgi:hypothetical protein